MRVIENKALLTLVAGGIDEGGCILFPPHGLK
ncbi:hypothetical protein PRUB_a6005 [Pseudoalteromonas rubra]|uniref:Uncharacterized protein n=1 Tax=Pseudoalteromonas rubra TaxID=43658 RepID=A0A8T0C4F6_9GAMM|nr:hypothetical protein PRUB_a6005 [Pseudoalteromonas rubra]